jgi:hypothetical protein
MSWIEKGKRIRNKKKHRKIAMHANEKKTNHHSRYPPRQLPLQAYYGTVGASRIPGKKWRIERRRKRLNTSWSVIKE